MYQKMIDYKKIIKDIKKFSDRQIETIVLNRLNVIVKDFLRESKLTSQNSKEIEKLICFVNGYVTSDASKKIPKEFARKMIALTDKGKVNFELYCKTIYIAVSYFSEKGADQYIAELNSKFVKRYDGQNKETKEKFKKYNQFMSFMMEFVNAMKDNNVETDEELMNILLDDLPSGKLKYKKKLQKLLDNG